MSNTIDSEYARKLVNQGKMLKRIDDLEKKLSEFMKARLEKRRPMSPNVQFDFGEPTIIEKIQMDLSDLQKQVNHINERLDKIEENKTKLIF